MECNTYPRKYQNGTVIYWIDYRDESGRRVRKSTGCTTKKQLEVFLENLELQEKQNELNKNRVKFCEYAACFFDDKGTVVSGWKEHGKSLKKKTLAGYRANLANYLMPWFADFFLDEIDAKSLDERLKVARKKNRSKDPDRVMSILSGAAKNEIVNTLVIIFQEAVFDRKIKEVPAFKKFARNSKSQSTLSREEIGMLFPFAQDEFGKCWSSPYDEKDKKPGIMFATMAAIAVSCGLRSGEVCALSMDQIIEGKGFVIDKQLDDDRKAALPKMGSAIDPRFRVVPVSDYTFTFLNRWLDIRGKEPGLIFRFQGEPVAGGYLLKRFRRAMDACGIDTTSRRITFHGLRYTFNSKQKMRMSRDDLHEIVGHTNDKMTDHYDRPIMEERLDELRDRNIDAMNDFWKIG